MKEPRKDKRRPEEIRRLFLKVGVNGKAKGSAYVEAGNTKVITAIYGPREILRRQDFRMKGILYCEVKIANFATQMRAEGNKEAREQELSAVLRHSLEPVVCLHLYPKSQIDVYVHVLEDDGSCLATLITCAGLALCDAAIQTYDLIVGMGLRYIGGNIYMDPTHDEEKESASSGENGSVIIGLMPSVQQLATIFQYGDVSAQSVTKACKELMSMCQEVTPVLQECLLNACPNSPIAEAEHDDQPDL